MQIQRKSAAGNWNTVIGATLSRVSSDWGKYVFDLAAGTDGLSYRIILEQSDLDKLLEQTGAKIIWSDP